MHTLNLISSAPARCHALYCSTSNRTHRVPPLVSIFFFFCVFFSRVRPRVQSLCVLSIERDSSGSVLSLVFPVNDGSRPPDFFFFAFCCMPFADDRVVLARVSTAAGRDWLAADWVSYRPIFSASGCVRTGFPFGVFARNQRYVPRDTMDVCLGALSGAKCWIDPSVFWT